MGCEMCGATETAAVIRVEGVEMDVCNNCTSYGPIVRRKGDRAAKQQAYRAPPRPREPTTVEKVRSDVAKLLKTHREKLGLTPDKFAAKMRIKLSTYHHYESGHALPDLNTAHVLSRELGVQLVVREEIKQVELHKDDSEGLTIGDLIKKKR